MILLYLLLQILRRVVKRKRFIKITQNIDKKRNLIVAPRTKNFYNRFEFLCATWGSSIGRKCMGREKRVQSLKRLLIFGPYVAVLIPLIFCVILLCLFIGQNRRISQLDEDLEKIAKNQSELINELIYTQNEVAVLTESVKQLSDDAHELSAKIVTYNNSSVENKRDPNLWPRKVYLTFDDGPSVNTEKILDILDRYGVKGNFFVVGTDSANLRKMYKRIVDDGHTIGMHSYTHKYSEVYASKDAFIADLDKISKLIYEETGVEPKIYRFPGGSSNNVSRVPMSELIKVLDDRKIRYFDWNVLSGDATNPALPVEDIITNSLATLSDNEESMILFHDLSNKSTTVEALPTIIEAILEQGITIAPIDDTTMSIQHNK